MEAAEVAGVEARARAEGLEGQLERAVAVEMAAGNGFEEEAGSAKGQAVLTKAVAIVVVGWWEVDMAAGWWAVDMAAGSMRMP